MLTHNWKLFIAMFKQIADIGLVIGDIAVFEGCTPNKLSLQRLYSDADNLRHLKK